MFETGTKELASSLNPLENAKLNAAMAYATYSLFYMYMKVQGLDTESHPVSRELNRVKEYFHKLAEITDSQKGPSIRVNQEAAKRVVAAGTGQQRKLEQNQEEAPTKGTTEAVTGQKRKLEQNQEETLTKGTSEVGSKKRRTSKQDTTSTPLDSDQADSMLIPDQNLLSSSKKKKSKRRNSETMNIEAEEGTMLKEKQDETLEKSGEEEGEMNVEVDSEKRDILNSAKKKKKKKSKNKKGE